MEIDELALQDEQTSGFLVQYLNGEISFQEWLQLQSGDHAEENVQGGEIIPNEVNDVDMVPSAHEVVAGEHNEDEVNSEVLNEEECPDSSAELFHPSIAKFPKKMTELLLLGKTPQTAKSVDEFMSEIPSLGKKKKRGGRRKLRELSKEHRGIMGKINMLYAKKDFGAAWNLCEELIQKAPRCPEPFQTLAFICEEKNDPEKAHQYKLIAAHLGAADCEEWIELGQTSLKRGNSQEAMICFTEASKLDPTNVDILITKASIYETLKQPKKKMEIYENILKVLPDDGAKYFTFAKNVAQLYHGENQDEKAIEVFVKAFKKYPDEIKFEDVNILSELYMSLRKFHKAFQIICQYCNIQFVDSEYCTSLVNAGEALTEEDLRKDKLSDYPFEIPEELPVDIRAKMIVCLIHNKTKLETIQDVISPLFVEPIEEVGDLYLDIADAYCETGLYEEALLLLDPLVKTEQFGQAAVWLKKAECLSTLGKEDEAAEAYSWVVSLAPSHAEARFTLSTLYQRLGQSDKALKLLEEMPSSDKDKDMWVDSNDMEIRDVAQSRTEPDIKSLSVQEVKLIYHRCLLLYSQNKLNGFLADGLTLLAQYMADVYYDESMQSDNMYRNYRTALGRMRRVAEEIPEALRVQGGVFADIRREEWWDLLVKVAKTFQKVGRLSDMEYIIKCAMSSVQFSGIKTYQRELDFLGVTACYVNGNITAAFNVIRVILLRCTECTHLWNMFARMMVGNGDSKHQKFCLRLLLKNPESFALQMINGHNALTSANYRYALGEYARAFRQKPMEPIVSLLMGLSFLQMACQKSQYGRNGSIIQAFLFLYQYEGLRGRCQETDYNLGRSYHQLGLVDFASHYYHKVLKYPTVGGENNEKCWDKNNLHREAAFNLSLIYRNSGNNQTARDLLQKYCTF